jgi:hypothetical protein
MQSLIYRYARWLHTGWPAGRVEKLPIIGPDGRTNVPGLYACGDLTGIPLLKFALDSGVRAVRAIKARLDAQQTLHGPVPDLLILGAGVSGMAAAAEAKRLGLAFEVLESSEAFATLVNFPKRKPIFTYPRAMTPAGELQVNATVKESLLEELAATGDGSKGDSRPRGRAAWTRGPRGHGAQRRRVLDDRP